MRKRDHRGKEKTNYGQLAVDHLSAYFVDAKAFKVLAARYASSIYPVQFGEVWSIPRTSGGKVATKASHRLPQLLSFAVDFRE
jgi:hypothetical protein